MDGSKYSLSLPEVVGWSKDSLRYTSRSWIAVRIVLGLPDVVGW